MKPLLGVIALLPCLALAQAAGTQTVYRSVGADGVVTFTDRPPADDVPAQAYHIDVPAAHSPQDYQQRLDDMRETTDRMAADRRERELHRAQLREIAAREAAPAPAAPPQVIDYGISSSTWYAPGYGYYPPGAPPWRPGHGHRPRPQPYPGVAVPPLDLDAWSASHNSQLMRPMLPRHH